MARKMISVSCKKLKDYISNSGDSVQKASFNIGASHDYLGVAMRRSERGMIKISDRYFNAFCELYNADPEDLRTRPYNRKENPAKGCEQMEFDCDDEIEDTESSKESIGRIPVEYISIEADLADSLKEIAHHARAYLAMIELALSGGC